ncbi:MAG: DUF763 domain-containing protein [Firmicutes bacterium]|nr:DUF763 domain-containing protein [Bacillota bacterium]
MKRTGTATSPLHTGHCPPWLFQKMQRLSAAMVEAMILDYGPRTVLARFSDPGWFQAFGCVLGFDWHSSGLTTVVLGALKEGWGDRARDYGFYIVGGKGRTALNTPQEIAEVGSRDALQRAQEDLITVSRLTAKVDNALVQDGYTLYHHVLLFDRQGSWAVVQQGMNAAAQRARRYHWFSEAVETFTVAPHQGIVGVPEPQVLDLTHPDNVPAQAASLAAIRTPHESLTALASLRQGPDGTRHLALPDAHLIPSPHHFDQMLAKLYMVPPETYQDLVLTPGVGPSTLRALAMVAEVIHGTPLTYRDPVRYSFAHGGKDGTPFPVRRQDYAETIATLEQAIRHARLGETEQLDAFRRLSRLAPRS